MTVRVCEHEVSDVRSRWDRREKRARSLNEICILRRELFRGESYVSRNGLYQMVSRKHHKIFTKSRFMTGGACMVDRGGRRVHPRLK